MENAQESIPGNSCIHLCFQVKRPETSLIESHCYFMHFCYITTENVLKQADAKNKGL